MHAIPLEIVYIRHSLLGGRESRHSSFPILTSVEERLLDLHCSTLPHDARKDGAMEHGIDIWRPAFPTFCVMTTDSPAPLMKFTNRITSISLTHGLQVDLADYLLVSPDSAAPVPRISSDRPAVPKLSLPFSSSPPPRKSSIKSCFIHMLDHRFLQFGLVVLGLLR